MKIKIYIGYLVLLIVLISCKKQEETLGKGPYDGGKGSFGVEFSTDLPKPAQAKSGDEVTFIVKGLKEYESKAIFMINEQKAEIRKLTDSTITVLVPELVSSGGASVLIGEQVFYGPNLEIKGSINVNNAAYTPSFAWTVGGVDFGAVVLDSYSIGSSRYYVGQFSNYKSSANQTRSVNSMARTDLLGNYDANFNPGKTGLGSFASVRSITRTDKGKFIISGAFSEFNNRSFVHNITRINADGTLDKDIIRVINPTPEILWKNQDTVPSFNGNFDGGSVIKHIVQVDKGEEKILVAGTFKSYFKYRYDVRPTYDFKNRSYTDIKSLARLKSDGSLDSTFNFDLVSGKGKVGPNGLIYDVAVHNNQVYVIGSFTTHNGASANRIMRLTSTGEVDASFNVGSGADGAIMSIKIDQNKIVLAGAFLTFNGQPHSGVVVLNTDGSIDETFKFKTFEGGIPVFARLLSNNKVVVSGGFDKYDGVKRGGFLVLERDGTALQKYNTLGQLSGQVNNVIEGKSSLGKFQLTLIGCMYKIGSTSLQGIVSIDLD